MRHSGVNIEGSGIMKQIFADCDCLDGTYREVGEKTFGKIEFLNFQPLAVVHYVILLVPF